MHKLAFFLLAASERKGKSCSRIFKLRFLEFWIETKLTHQVGALTFKFIIIIGWQLARAGNDFIKSGFKCKDSDADGLRFHRPTWISDMDTTAEYMSHCAMSK